MSTPRGEATSMQLDPAAVAAYNVAMQRVADELVSAARLAAGASAATQLTSDLGPVGAGFAAEFGSTIEAHALALTAGAHLITEYGKVLTSFTRVATQIDAENADAITRIGARL